MRYPDRELFFYEAPEDGGGAPPPEPVPAETPPEPAPEAQAEEPFAVSPEDWQRVAGFQDAAIPILQQMAAYMEQQQQQGGQQQYPAQQQQAPQEEPLPDYDPFDPESTSRYINEAVARGVQRGMQEQMGMYEPVLGQIAQREAEQLARSELGKLQENVGAFNEDAALLVAAGVIEQGGDPSQALLTAAHYMRDFEAKLRQDAVEAYKKELGQIAEAPQEAPTGTPAQVQETPPQGARRYEEVVENFLRKQNAQLPVG